MKMEPIDIMKEICDQHYEYLYNNIGNMINKEYGIRSAEFTLMVTHLILKILNENTEDFFNES